MCVCVCVCVCVYLLTSKYTAAQFTWVVEYTNCISAER